jgi:hypothetical protein
LSGSAVFPCIEQAKVEKRMKLKTIKKFVLNLNIDEFLLINFPTHGLSIIIIFSVYNTKFMGIYC